MVTLGLIFLALGIFYGIRNHNNSGLKLAVASCILGIGLLTNSAVFAVLMACYLAWIGFTDLFVSKA